MNLNAKQNEAATYNGDSKNILVIAGAGTGKTRTLTARVSFLAKQMSVPINRILAITFTNRAAEEMRNRIAPMIIDSDKMAISTFHAFALSIMINNTEYFPTKKYTILDGEDQLNVIKMLVTKEQENHASPLPPAKKVCEVINYCRNAFCPVNKVLKRFQIEDKVDEINTLIIRYGQYKYKKNYLDFDDLILKVIMKMSIDESFQDKITSMYDHILIDEFQDINPLQKKLVDFFNNKKVNMFVVGDDAQSIYGFRSSSFAFIHQFESIYPESKVFKLTENYRSGQEHIDVSNWLLNKSKIDYKKQLYSSRGNDCYLPSLIRSENIYDEAATVADIIEKKIADGVSPDEILVLSRSNFDTVMLKKELQAKSITYQVIGGDNANKKKHIKDYLSALRVFMNLNDEIAWFRYLQVFRGTGKKKAEKIIARILNQHDHHAVSSLLTEHLGEYHPAVVIYKAITHSDSTPKSLIHVLQGFIPNILSAKKFASEESDIDAISRYAEKFGTVRDLMNDLTLEASSTSYLRNKHRNVVTLSTIHGAKGTEADITIIMSLKPGSFPHARAVTSDEVEEERRVLYVALTRVKKEMFLSFVKPSEGQSGDSFLLKGIPANLLNTESRT
jgi:DNA helicase-2/ATP-dependent DNA helicase PcrA